MRTCFNRYLTFVQPSSHIVCQRRAAVWTCPSENYW